uniref:Uncharacterized protein n=1 Tax=Rhizophora mucronata TaxID=61149 RepID=A0A2P2Q4U8_RHIMU
MFNVLLNMTTVKRTWKAVSIKNYCYKV